MPRIGNPRGPGGNISGIIAPPRVHNVIFTKPITIKVAHTLLADADIFESFCENERDRVHLENAKPQR